MCAWTVARRCVPTGIDLESEVSSVFNFSSPSELQRLAAMNMTNSFGFEDLVLNLSVQSIIDGSA